MKAQFEELVRELGENQIGINTLEQGQLPPSYNDGSGYCPEGHVLISKPDAQSMVDTLKKKVGEQLADAQAIWYELSESDAYAQLRIYVVPRNIPDLPRLHVPNTVIQELAETVNNGLTTYKQFERYRDQAIALADMWEKLSDKDIAWITARYKTVPDFMTYFLTIVHIVKSGAELQVRNCGKSALSLKYVISDFPLDERTPLTDVNQDPIIG